MSPTARSLPGSSLSTLARRLIGAAIHAAILVVASGAALPAQAAPLRCHVQGSHHWLATRPSPLDSSDLVDGGFRARICYSAPSARGRSVYDSLAPFGRAWRTGANEATVLELSAPAVVAGASLEAGRYAILTVPGPQSWWIVFHTFTDSDDPASVFQNMVEAGRGRAAAETLPVPVERFVIHAVRRPAGGEFLLEWGTLRARVPVLFQPR